MVVDFAYNYLHTNLDSCNLYRHFPNLLCGHKEHFFLIGFIPRLDFMLLFRVHSSKFGKCLLQIISGCYLNCSAKGLFGKLCLTIASWKGLYMFFTNLLYDHPDKKNILCF